MFDQMPMIQFVSSVNLTQMWLMKVSHNRKKTFCSKNLNIPWNHDWLKRRIRKCKQFNSCQMWIWFKSNWGKCTTVWKTPRSQNFNIPWNQDWSKQWTTKCVRFNSSQVWIWFKDNESTLPMAVQRNNRLRNPRPRSPRINRCRKFNTINWINWTISHNNSTFTEHSWVWFTDSLSLSKRWIHQCDVIGNRGKEHPYWEVIRPWSIERWNAEIGFVKLQPDWGECRDFSFCRIPFFLQDSTLSAGVEVLMQHCTIHTGFTPFASLWICNWPQWECWCVIALLRAVLSCPILKRELQERLRSEFWRSITNHGHNDHASSFYFTRTQSEKALQRNVGLNFIEWGFEVLRKDTSLRSGIPKVSGGGLSHISTLTVADCKWSKFVWMLPADASSRNIVRLPLTMQTGIDSKSTKSSSFASP
jgi:hypothetical protein